MSMWENCSDYNPETERDLVSGAGRSNNCTWAGCTSEGKYELRGRDGRQRALLCDAHNAEMDAAVNSPQVGDIVRCWVKAQGGAKAAAERMMVSFNYARFLRVLSGEGRRG